MAASYKAYAPFNVPMKLLQPTISVVQGVRKKTFPSPESVTDVFFCSFRTFGGTERMNNDVYTVEDTATCDTWYNPNLQANCRVFNCLNAKVYEVIGTPENIDMRNQYMRFKLRAVGGQP